MTFQTTTDKIGPDVQYYEADSIADAHSQLVDDVAMLATIEPEFEPLVAEVDYNWLEPVVSDARYRAYRVDEFGVLDITYVEIVSGTVYSASGWPLSSDDETVSLRGWPDDSAMSYERGRVLVTTARYE